MNNCLSQKWKEPPKFHDGRLSKTRRRQPTSPSGSVETRRAGSSTRQPTAGPVTPTSRTTRDPRLPARLVKRDPEPFWLNCEHHLPQHNPHPGRRGLRPRRRQGPVISHLGRRSPACRTGWPFTTRSPRARLGLTRDVTALTLRYAPKPSGAHAYTATKATAQPSTRSARCARSSRSERRACAIRCIRARVGARVGEIQPQG